jgi:CHAT domain-containing protein/tetratricopeptide (TPR) repeat protein
MTQVGEQFEAVLEAAGAGGTPAVMAWLSNSADPAAVLIALAEEADRAAVGDLPRSLRAAEALVGAADAGGWAGPRARARRALAQGLCYANRFAEALVVLGEARGIGDAAGLRVESARARLTEVHALARMGRLEEAIASGREAIAVFEAAGEAMLAARAEVNVGVCLRMRGRAEAALASFQRARGVFAEQPGIAAQIDSNAAEALLDLDRFDEAEAAFESALGALTKLGMVQAAAIVEGNLGDLANRQGRARQALERFERARRRFAKAGAEGDAARLEAERAETLMSLGLFAEAVESYELSCVALAAKGLRGELARALVGRARALMRTGRTDGAGGLLASAAGIYEQNGHVAGLARVRAAEGALAGARGDWGASVEAYRAALTLAADRPADRAGVLIRLGVSLHKLGDAQGAIAAIDEGLGVARSLGLWALAAAGLHARACVRAGLGQGDWACADAGAAADEVERLRALLPGQRFRAAFLGEFAGIYADWLSWRLDAGGAKVFEDALRIAERAKSRSLLEQIDDGHDGPGAWADETAATGEAVGAVMEGEWGTGALLAELASRRRTVAALYHELEDPSLKLEGRAARENWSERLRANERAIRDAESRLAATGRFRVVAPAPVGVDEVRGALTGASSAGRDGAAMVLYSVESGPRGARLVALVMRGGQRRVAREVGLVSEVGRRVQAFSFQVARALSRGLGGAGAGRRMCEDAEDELRGLYDLVWSPVREAVGDAGGVVVVPHGPLHALPFGALLDESGERLGKGRAVWVCPSASVMSRLAKGRSASAGVGGALVVGVSDALAPSAEAEAEAIARRLHESARLQGATLLRGSEATIQAFAAACRAGRTGARADGAREQHGRGLGLIHIASHARFQPEDPEASGIRLADGWLTLRELQGLDLGGASVVLSACDSGRHTLSGADELQGFIHAFLVAGARELALSLWPVHDRTTAELMAEVYDRWYGVGEGGGGVCSGDLARALAMAQDALRSRVAHPAAWAPFVAIGAPA